MCKNTEELCRLINKGMYIQSFFWERKYVIEEDCTRDDLIMTFSPEINSLGERLLKVKFKGVNRLCCEGIFNCIFQPSVIIKDISDRGYENDRFFVEETEYEFCFYCADIEYCWEQSEDERA